jgi:predicted transcriptional regulator
VIGYTQLVIKRNEEADPSLVGVTLGKLCIDKGVPVQTVANYFGVSKATIYAWFAGTKQPRAKIAQEINEFIKNLAD